jgi:hypothetical protein
MHPAAMRSLRHGPTKTSCSRPHGLIAIVLYLFVYGADPGLQNWYTANFVIPWIFVLGGVSRVIERDRILRVFGILRWPPIRS